MDTGSNPDPYNIECDFSSLADSTKHFVAFTKEISDDLIKRLAHKAKIQPSIVEEKIMSLKISELINCTLEDFFLKQGDAILWPKANRLKQALPSMIKVIMCVDENKFQETLNLLTPEKAQHSVLYINGIEPNRIQKKLEESEVKFLMVIWVNPRNWANLALYSFARALKKVRLEYPISDSPEKRTEIEIKKEMEYKEHRSDEFSMHKNTDSPKNTSETTDMITVLSEENKNLGTRFNLMNQEREEFLKMIENLTSRINDKEKEIELMSKSHLFHGMQDNLMRIELQNQEMLSRTESLIKELQDKNKELHAKVKKHYKKKKLFKNMAARMESDNKTLQKEIEELRAVNEIESKKRQND